MSLERKRRDRFATPPPVADELKLVGLVIGLVFVFALPLIVQGVAAWFTTGTFALPTSRLAAAYGALLGGHFGAGLPRQTAASLPHDGVLWTLTAVSELLGLIVMVVVGVQQDAHRRRSGHGLATARQASTALGLPRLRRAAAVVRPDLYGRAASQGTGRGRTAARMRRKAGEVGRRRRIEPHQVGWPLGRVGKRGPGLWVPFDRTTCVIGPQGSGKTLDLLAPALLAAPGAALVTLTKPDDLFLTIDARQRGDRPIAVLDPFGIAPGVPELVWDPIAGCRDAMCAERRAKAFASGTVKGAASQSSDQAARFYAGECAKVLQAYFHAAAITGLSLDEVLAWVSSPRDHPQPEEILRTHPDAEPLWDGLLRGALFGDERTAGNTITTVQQAMSLFFQRTVRQRCVPSPTYPATDISAVIRAGGTIYLLGRDDPYASASPLMTAVTEHILDTAKRMGETSPHGRLCPPFLACLDELPSTAPIPTLATRMANERALGLSFILAAQTWRQFVVCYGEDEARTVLGLSNNLVSFGGGKDIRFYQELSDLLGSTTHTEVRYSRRGQDWFGVMDRSYDLRRVPVLEPAELRQIEDRKAVVVAETHRPIVASMSRCIDGRQGRRLLADQDRARRRAAGFRHPAGDPTPSDLTTSDVTPGDVTRCELMPPGCGAGCLNRQPSPNSGWGFRSD